MFAVNFQRISYELNGHPWPFQTTSLCPSNGDWYKSITWIHSCVHYIIRSIINKKLITIGFIFNDKSNSFSWLIIQNYEISGCQRPSKYTQCPKPGSSCQTSGEFAFSKWLNDPNFNLSPLPLVIATAETKISLPLSPLQWIISLKYFNTYLLSNKLPIT